ncbi:hypothetical protein ANN_23079 [Periplaneta americana]|uniref:Uncharacterized protein n=1 Tax=Periplaneta americana TaxID=6978 RepID=A0ABQ8SK78_PERAM|nr:hypothetical protein ANN_23079 [Periplaneta americana]
MGESRNLYSVLVGRPEGKRHLGRPRRRWEDNIKMDLREVGYDDREWINLAQDRDQWRAYVRVAMNLRVPSKPVNNYTVSSETVVIRFPRSISPNSVLRESIPQASILIPVDNEHSSRNHFSREWSFRFSAVLVISSDVYNRFLPQLLQYMILKATRIEDSRTCGVVIKALVADRESVSQSVSQSCVLKSCLGQQRATGTWVRRAVDRSRTCSELGASSKELRQPSYYRGASRSRWGKSGCDVGKGTVPVRKYDSILKALSSLENANIFLERTILTPECDEGENAGEMSPESNTESYPAFAHIGLRENPEKPQPGNLPRLEIEPGPPGFAAGRADRYSTGRVCRWKFMSEEAVNGIQIPLKSVCARVLAATGISKRTLARIRKEGENIEAGTADSFSSPEKSQPF